MKKYYNIKIYTAVDNRSKYSKEIKEIDIMLSKLFGGMTRYNSVGGWIDKSRFYYDKNGIVYDIYVNTKEYNFKSGVLYRLIEKIKKKFNQKSVFVSIIESKGVYL